MKSSTKALFGGALFAAGLAVTSEAQATGTWNVIASPYTFTQAYGLDYGTFGAYGAYAYGVGTTTYTFNSPYLGGYARADLTTSSMHAQLDATAGYSGFASGYAKAVSQALVTVAVPTNIDLNWDFTGAYGVSLAQILVYDLDNYLVVYVANDPTAGSASVTLNPGTNYILQIRADSAAPTGAQLWGDITVNKIPAPGALALLGLGGLVASRRRRT